MRTKPNESATARLGHVLVLAGLGLVGALSWLLAQEFRITEVGKDQSSVTLSHEANPAYYYILYRGSNIVNISFLTTMGLGEWRDPGTGEAVLQDLNPLPDTTFYRVLRLSTSQPRDSDGDGIDDVYELRRRPWLNPLNPADSLMDYDNDGLSNLEEYRLGSNPAVAAVVLTTLTSSPFQGEASVAVTRETILQFSAPLASNTVITASQLFATFAGQQLLSRIELSSDRRKATLFYLQNLPGSARIRVTFNGNAVQDTRGNAVDADGDGQPGGVRLIDFDTQSQTMFPNTIVCGRVFASELAVRTNGSTNLSINVPLAGVIVTADGLEQDVRAVTDAFGNFRLTNAPAGPFFVHIDGRPVRDDASGLRYPDLAYYPFVGKLWHSIPGGETNIGEVYLPRVAAGTLQPVSAINDTVISFPSEVLAEHPELEGVSLTVPANSLFSDNGTRGGMIGIAPVPPDRLPGPLPSGLNLPLVITVQTDGGLNFDAPVPICFPNLENLPPGSKSALWSFNHDIGEFEIVGPMTVSADGRLVCTDPGVGIPAPGWHGTGLGCSNEGDDGQGYASCNEYEPPTCSPGESGGDPIYFSTGEFYYQTTDLQIKGVGLNFTWSRVYRSKQSTEQEGIGYGWDFSYNISLNTYFSGFLAASAASVDTGGDSGGEIALETTFSESPDETLGVIFRNGGTGRKDYFEYDSEQGQWAANGHFLDITRDSNGSYTMRFPDLTEWTFVPPGDPGEYKIARMEDRNGNALQFDYSISGLLEKITDTLGRQITVHWTLLPSGSSNPLDPTTYMITAVEDFLGRRVTYDYITSDDPDGNIGDLRFVTTPPVTGTPNGNDFPTGKTISYTYEKAVVAPDEGVSSRTLEISATVTTKDLGGGGYAMTASFSSDGSKTDNVQHNLLTITDGRRNDPSDPTYGGDPFVINEYGTEGIEYDRVIKQVWGGDALYIKYLDSDTNDVALNYPIKVIVSDRERHVSEYIYDDGNICTSIREYTGEADVGWVTDTENRPAGKLRAGDPEYYETLYSYNADYLLTRVVRPNGNYTELVYEADLTPDASVNARGNLRFKRDYPGPLASGDDPAVIEQEFRYAEDGGSCCGTEFLIYHRDGRGSVTEQAFDENGNLRFRRHRIDDIFEEFQYNSRGQIIRRILPDNGSGSKRIDDFEYYETGSQKGYLYKRIVDSANLALTSVFEHDAVGNIIKVTDPENNSADLEYNSLDQLMRITFPLLDGAAVRYRRTFAYDANDNLIEISTLNVDGDGTVNVNAGLTTLLEYEPLNKLARRTQEVDPGHNVVTEYTYDRNRNFTGVRYGEAAAGRQSDNRVVILYDERNLPYLITRGWGGSDPSTTQLDYDGNRNLAAIHRGLEDATPRTFSYSQDGWERLKTVRDPLGNIATLTYDENHNRTELLVEGELVDIGGDTNNVRLKEVVFTYDLMDRLTSRTEQFFRAADQSSIGDGESTLDIEYSDVSQILRVVNDNSHAVVVTYDSANRLARLTDPKGNTRDFSYDDNSNIVRVDETDLSDLGGSQEFVTLGAYDALNRLINITDTIGNTTEYKYDARNNRTQRIDAKGNKVGYTYDGLNRLIETEYFLTNTGEGSGTATGSIVNLQTWDDTSRLTSQIDGNGNATVYTYDGLNRKTATTYADGTVHATSYDAHDNAVLMIDANGNEVVCAYDELDRLIRKDITPGSGVSADTTFEEYQYDGLSRIISALDDDSEVTFAYDSLSQVLAETLNGTMTACEYDGVGNLLRCIYPSGRTVSNIYDELERKKVISDDDGLVAQYYFVGPNRVHRRDYGNGTRTDYAYNGILGVPNAAGDLGVKRISRIKHSKIADGTVLDERTFAWDAVYNKISHNDVRAGGPGTEISYGYDSVYRLIESVRHPPVGSLGTVTYQYDDVGNRTFVTGGASAGTYFMSVASPEPADRKMNQYTQTPFGSHSYDANGNLVSTVVSGSPEKSFTYDYANRMVAFSNVTAAIGAAYTYDVFGRRIEKTVIDSGRDTDLYFYRAWTSVEEQDLTTADTIAHIRGLYIDELLASRKAADSLYHHSDDQYTPNVLSDSAGDTIEWLSYDDFGFPRTTTSSGAVLTDESSIAHLFSGRRFDPETPLLYYRTRHADPLTGRFSTRDPIGPWADEINMGNETTYVGNRPTTLNDPFGLMSLLLKGSYYAIVGGGAEFYFDPKEMQLMLCIETGFGGGASLEGGLSTKAFKESQTLNYEMAINALVVKGKYKVELDIQPHLDLINEIADVREDEWLIGFPPASELCDDSAPLPKVQLSGELFRTRGDIGLNLNNLEVSGNIKRRKSFGLSGLNKVYYKKCFVVK